MNVTVIPLGYRCSITMILLEMGLRVASHPFDWTITSDSDVVADCLRTDFKHYMDASNYEVNHDLVLPNRDGTVTRHWGYFNKHYSDRIDECLANKLLLLHTDPRAEYFTRRCWRFLRMLQENRPFLFVRLERGFVDQARVATLHEAIAAKVNRFRLLVIGIGDEANRGEDWFTIQPNPAFEDCGWKFSNGVVEDTRIKAAILDAVKSLEFEAGFPSNHTSE